MGKVELAEKLIGLSIKTLKRTAPEQAVTYDFISGVGKKGKFNVWSYKDKSGKLLRKEFLYKNGDDTTTIVREYHHDPDNKSRAIWNEKFLNNKPQETSAKIIIFDSSKQSKDAWMQDIHFGETYDTHQISYLSPAQKRQFVSYGTFWDGSKPFGLTTVSKSGKKMPKQYSEYLPLITDRGFGYSTESRMNHISKIQEQKFGLEGVTPPVRRVPSTVINEIKDIGIEKILGDCNCFNGQIRVNDEIHNSRKLLSILGHEYRHASDLSKFMQLEESVNEFRALPIEEIGTMELKHPGARTFMERSIAKGIIPDKSKLGKELKEMLEKWDWEHKIPHDERYEEILANLEAEKEVSKLDSVIEELKNVFGAKFSM